MPEFRPIWNSYRESTHTWHSSRKMFVCFSCCQWLHFDFFSAGVPFHSIGTIQLALEIGERYTKSILVCVDERYKYTRNYQWTEQKNHVCDSVVLHHDMYDGAYAFFSSPQLKLITEDKYTNNLYTRGSEKKYLTPQYIEKKTFTSLFLVLSIQSVSH